MIRIRYIQTLLVTGITGAAVTCAPQLSPPETCIQPQEYVCFHVPGVTLKTADRGPDFSLYSGKVADVEFGFYLGNYSQFNKKGLRPVSSMQGWAEMKAYEKVEDNIHHFLIVGENISWPSEVHIWTAAGSDKKLETMRNLVSSFSYNLDLVEEFIDDRNAGGL